eukprot:7205601-Alexandrium_andersonii.AAC.1
MPVTLPKNLQRLATSLLYAVAQQFLRCRADQRRREAAAQRVVAQAAGAGDPLPLEAKASAR